MFLLQEREESTQEHSQTAQDSQTANDSQAPEETALRPIKPNKRRIDNTSSKEVVTKKRTTSKSTAEDPMLKKAFELLQKSAETDNMDSYSIFGQHIANELRKYDPRTLSIVKQAFNNIIFEADMGRLVSPNVGYLYNQYTSSAYTCSSIQNSTSIASTPEYNVELPADTTAEPVRNFSSTSQPSLYRQDSSDTETNTDTINTTEFLTLLK